MDNWIEDKFSKDKEGWILIFTVKDDGWILQIEELNTQDAEPCFLSYFLSYFQLRSLEIKIMLLSSLFFFLREKSKKLYFPTKLCHFFHTCLFFVQKKKAFAFCLHAWFSVPCVKILQSTFDFITYSVHMRKTAIISSTGFVDFF